MVKKPKQPAETAELKKQIESIVGHEIDPGGEPIIKFSSPAGSYTFFGEVVPESVTACWRRIYPFPNKVCSPGVGLLEATGVSSTLADGKRVFHVSDVICPQGRILWFCGTHQCRCHAPCREPNLPHHDLLADTAGSGSVNSP
jgi:hypothetical protein